ncbi:hypothetical protein HK098_004051 [Nowakowskiella sp. JEL0407]|nr:hypothetical protein HK098_004051 [Nowakowskiella sp. JEL0407]
MYGNEHELFQDSYKKVNPAVTAPDRPESLIYSIFQREYNESVLDLLFGTNPNEIFGRFRSGETAYHFLHDCKDLRFFKYLVKKSAEFESTVDIDTLNNTQTNAFLVPCFDVNHGLVEAMILPKPDIIHSSMIQDGHKLTPLLIACLQKDT